MTVEAWKTVGLSAAALGQLIFVTLYLTFPWWRSFLGRALFAKALIFALLLWAVVVGRAFDWPAKSVTFAIMYGLIAVGIWSQVWAFIHVMLTKNRDDWEQR